MKAHELAVQLKNKKRSVDDIARYIATRTDQNPNYTLLLGAGCSITSGIRSATSLTNEWRKEFSQHSDPEEQRNHLKLHHNDWYDPQREYSCLFEKKYDLQRQRRMFVEMEVSGKTPSLGYAYLTSLVSDNYFNTIFTTNFDDLINEAFYSYSNQRPIVCAHDSSINSITVTSKRPKVIKLHGDFLFDDIKSTARETESLEQNMKSKFSEFAKDYGLIVVGYSGCDRSIMDVISLLLKNDAYFKNGIYWCVRPDSEISEELKKLLWKEKVYFIEIEGFDEFFAELFSKLNNAEVLPKSTLSLTRRPVEIANKLLQSQLVFDTSSEILKKAHERLLKESKRSTLMNLVVPEDKDEYKYLDSQANLSDDEMITVLEVQNYLNSGLFAEVIKLGSSILQSENSAEVKKRVSNLIVNAHRALGQTDKAIAIVESMIQEQRNNISYYYLKADLLTNFKEKIKILDIAISLNPYNSRSHYRKANSLFINATSNKFGEEKRAMMQEALSSFDSSLLCNPSLDNPSWQAKLRLVCDTEKDKQVRSEKINEMLDAVNRMNPYSTRAYWIRLELLNGDGDRKDLNVLLEDINNSIEKSNEISHPYLIELKIRALRKFNLLEAIKTEIQSSSEKLLLNPDLAYVVSETLRNKFSDDNEAIEILSRSLKSEFDGDVLSYLLLTYNELGRTEDSRKLLTKYTPQLSMISIHKQRRRIFEVEKNYQAALEEDAKLQSLVGSNNINTYLLLKDRQFQKVQDVAKERLAQINYSLDASELIVNYEIACKKITGRLNEKRLESLLHFDGSQSTKAAIYCLLGKRREMIESIKKIMSDDKTFRFDAESWPVFDDLKSDSDFKNAISIS